MSNEWREGAFQDHFPEGSLRIMEYNYEGNYEGSGAAIALTPEPDSEFIVAEYAHCSCYGPASSMTAVGRYPTLLDALRATTERKELLQALTAEVG